MSGFRLKGSKRRSTMLSAQGLIRGGAHDGWRYTFQAFTCDARGNLRVELIVGDPLWPFPKTIELGRAGFNSLEPIKGERAAKIDAAPLIAAVLQIPEGERGERVLRLYSRYIADATPAASDRAPVGRSAGQTGDAA